ncbi:MAG: hypothetical protein HOV80_18670 [Polyangiaceae bacterium]|nr:hypothetical protein [Polyangiaceae bacterium]
MHTRFIVTSLVLALAGCGARSTLEEVDSDETPACTKDERIQGDGEWLRGLGPGKGAELARSANGRLVAAWRTGDQVTLDCEELEPIGDSDLVVASFEPTGEVAWAHRIGVSGMDSHGVRGIGMHHLGVDDDGNVFIAGLGPHGNKLDALGTTIDSELFVLSFDAAGALRWAHGYARDADGHVSLDAATVSPEGELTIAYTFQNRLQLDEWPVDGGHGGEMARALITWDPKGAVIRSSRSEGRSFGGLRAGPDGLLAVAWQFPDRTGELELLQGSTSLWSEKMWSVPWALWFRTSELVASSSPVPPAERTWLMGLDVGAGGIRWSSAFDEWNGKQGEFPPWASHLVDVDDGMVVAVPLLGSVDLGDQTFSSAGSFDAVLMHVEEGGLPRGFRKIGAAGEEVVTGLVSADAGRVGLMLQSDAPVDLGFGAPPSACNAASASCRMLTLAVIEAP